MIKPVYLFAAMLPVMLSAGIASAQQYPIMDEIANKVVMEYQNSSCEVTAGTRVHAGAAQ
jgi:hypothetical protein